MILDQVVVNLDPMGIVGRIYGVDHYTLLYSDYISCKPHGFRDL